MEKRKLGNSDLYITTVGLGTWAIGGGENPYGWGSQDDSDSIKTIHRAIELGINWIDTAKGYGHGHSEEIVGQAVADRRDKVVVATKCGILWKEDGSDIYGHLKADSIKAECRSSLRRLRSDYIDLLQIHWPMPDEDIEEVGARSRILFVKARCGTVACPISMLLNSNASNQSIQSFHCSRRTA